MSQRQKTALTLSPLQAAGNGELLTELRRRYIAFLFAGVYVNDRNESVTQHSQKGCIELMKMLHSEQELRLETITKAQLRRFSDRVTQSLDGDVLADGDALADNPIPPEGA